MEFRKKLKVRLYTAIVYIIIGAVFIGISFTRLGANEMISSFGAVFAVMGAGGTVRLGAVEGGVVDGHTAGLAECAGLVHEKNLLCLG